MWTAPGLADTASRRGGFERLLKHAPGFVAAAGAKIAPVGFEVSVQLLYDARGVHRSRVRGHRDSGGKSDDAAPVYLAQRLGYLPDQVPDTVTITGSGRPDRPHLAHSKVTQLVTIPRMFATANP